METLNKKKETLTAVYDDDLMGVLRELGVEKDFLRGSLNCHFCGDTITWDNLHSIFPLGGTVKLGCDKPECVEKLVSRMEQERLGV